MQHHSNYLFDDSVAITADSDSTNVLIVGQNKSRGDPLKIEVAITEAFNTLTSLTINVLQSADGSSWDTRPVVSSGAIPLADLILGAKVFQAALPPTHKKYIKLNYDVTGINPTLGKVFATLLPARELVN